MLEWETTGPQVRLRTICPADDGDADPPAGQPIFSQRFWLMRLSYGSERRRPGNQHPDELKNW
jgi:hypothetical protein